MAQTLMRATRLAQVISVLGNEKRPGDDGRACRDRGRRALLRRHGAAHPRLGRRAEHRRALGRRRRGPADGAVRAAGRRGGDEPESRCCIGAARSCRCPSGSRPIRRVTSPGRACSSATQSLGLMLLARRGDEPFEESEATELRAVAYRIALAIENGLLHQAHDRSARTAPPPAAADRRARRYARARRRRASAWPTRSSPRRPCRRASC